MSCSDVEFLKVNGYYYYRFTPTQIAECVKSGDHRRKLLLRDVLCALPTDTEKG